EGRLVRLYGAAQVVGQLHVTRPWVRPIPAPVGLGRLDVLQAMLGHPPLRDESGDVRHVDLAPDALRPPRRVALEVTLLVETLPDAVDPAPAEHDVYRILGDYRLQARTHLVDLDPQLVGGIVVLGQPVVELLGVLELADLGAIDRHGETGQQQEHLRPPSRADASAWPGGTVRTLLGLSAAGTP